MMYNRFFGVYLPLLAYIALGTGFTLAQASQKPFDPFFWLEEIHSEKALDWVNQQSAHTMQSIESDPKYKELYTKIRALLLADDRAPFSDFENGYFWNFWQDTQNKRGVLRRATVEEYKKPNPNWEVVLDIDAIAALENENWVFKGSVSLDKKSNRILVYLSRAGKDAVVVREYDIVTKAFIVDGFNISEAKTSVTPLSENEILFATDVGEGSTTKSGYARVLKLWRRGDPITAAKTVFEGSIEDTAVESWQISNKDSKYIIIKRAVDFFRTKYYLLQADGSVKKIPVPSLSNIYDINDSYIYVEIKKDLQIGSKKIPGDSVIRFPINDTSLINAEIIFSANQRQSLEGISVKNSNKIFIEVLDQVKSRVIELNKNEKGEWIQRVLDLPKQGTIEFSLEEFTEPQDLAIVTYSDFLTPKAQYILHETNGVYTLELMKQEPARFDSSQFEVLQYFATSADGTQIPYFIIKNKSLQLDGKNKTILYGYGGFNYSLAPNYNAKIAKAWLEEGNVYVIANIRGGGEFGYKWHQAAQKENRQKAYDDFKAVAADLIAKKVTAPAHLGIKGGSNGGLLAGVGLVQFPELINAVASEVPLLDMIRFSHLSAGDSWVAEYGDPDKPEECEFLLKISPYHNVKPNVHYPKALFTTSRSDDRVHAAHARKMAMRMLEQGHDVLLYETEEGGHGGSADLDIQAQYYALVFTFFSMSLK